MLRLRLLLLLQGERVKAGAQRSGNGENDENDSQWPVDDMQCISALNSLHVHYALRDACEALPKSHVSHMYASWLHESINTFLQTDSSPLAMQNPFNNPLHLQPPEMHNRNSELATTRQTYVW